MNGVLLMSAGVLIVGWLGGVVALNAWYLRRVRALRDHLRDRYPNPAWARMTQMERLGAQPFDAQGEAKFEAHRAHLRLLRTQGLALLAALGVTGIFALVIFARMSIA